MSKRKKRDALRPDCFKDEFFFVVSGGICNSCPFYYCCAANKFGDSFTNQYGLDRKKVEKKMVMDKVPMGDAVEAVSVLFGVTKNAAALSLGRKKRKGSKGKK